MRALRTDVRSMLLRTGACANGSSAAKGHPGYRLPHLDDIIASKAAANRVRDHEALPRLRAFREYWLRSRR